MNLRLRKIESMNLWKVSQSSYLPHLELTSVYTMQTTKKVREWKINNEKFEKNMKSKDKKRFFQCSIILSFSRQAEERVSKIIFYALIKYFSQLNTFALQSINEKLLHIKVLSSFVNIHVCHGILSESTANMRNILFIW